MREIKIRAWDAELSTMIYHTYDSPTYAAQLINGSLRVATNDSEGDTVSLELMQCIGLQDRHGKDIYEGDVLADCECGETIWDGKARVIKSPLVVVGYRAPAFDSVKIVLGEVEMMEDGVGKKKRDKQDLAPNAYDGVYQFLKPIIIGNIYEHPHILNA